MKRVSPKCYVDSEINLINDSNQKDKVLKEVGFLIERLFKGDTPLCGMSPINLN